MFNRRSLLAPSMLACALLIAAPAFADDAPAASVPPVTAAADPSAQAPAAKFVQDLGSKALVSIGDKSITVDQRRDRYRQMLHDSFDLPATGRFVLGRAWNTATPQQQQQFMELFENLVLKVYGDRISFYNGEGFTVKGSHAETDRDTVVNTEITHPDGPPTKVDWRVRNTNGKMAVVDVMVEGVSQSVTQRQEYASILQENNGNIDALLDRMRQRI